MAIKFKRCYFWFVWTTLLELINPHQYVTIFPILKREVTSTKNDKIYKTKSWHVRTKKNIARVRKDEAQAAEEEKETQRRIALAAQEARTALLRERASQRLKEAAGSELEEVAGDPEKITRVNINSEEEDLRFGLPLGSLRDVVQPDGHVNFFQDIEAGKRQSGVNEEYEEEKKKEQEDYEKKIGYLVYLGQDSLELSRTKPWYSNVDRGGGGTGDLDQEKAKERDLDQAAATIGGLEEKSKTISTEEIKMSKVKSFHDPLRDIKKSLSTTGVKRKLDSLPSSSSKSYQLSLPPPPKIKREEEETTKEKHKKHKHKKSKKSKKHKKRLSSSSKGKKSKKKSSRTHSSGSDYSSYSDEDSEEEKKRVKLEKLRAERLQREREERRKAEQVLAKFRGEPVEEPKVKKEDPDNLSMSRVKQKYNSQFNPHLARQNYD